MLRAAAGPFAVPVDGGEDLVLSAAFFLDGLNIHATDSNVALLACAEPDVFAWSSLGTPRCVVFAMLDERGALGKRIALPDGTVVDGGACSKRRFLDVQVVVSASGVAFRDGGSDDRQPDELDPYCSDAAAPNVLAGEIYVFLAVDDGSGYGTGVFDVSVSRGAADAVRRESDASGFAFAASDCARLPHAWLWYGTASCSPNTFDGKSYFLGALGPFSTSSASLDCCFSAAVSFAISSTT